MAIRQINNFHNCSAAVEDIPNPETGELGGRCIVIIDNDSGDIWRYPMPLEAAKVLGQRLMGIGDLAVTNGHEMQRAIKQHEKGRGK